MVNPFVNFLLDSCISNFAVKELRAAGLDVTEASEDILVGKDGNTIAGITVLNAGFHNNMPFLLTNPSV